MTHPTYRPDIDGLRAIAVLSVVGFHAFGIQAGFIGVDIFFVISGFLISSILFADFQNHSLSIIDFYRRRIRRIFPALLTVLLFCFGLGWFTLLADEFAALNKHIAAGLAFVSNLVLLGESGYFDSASNTKILLHLWSLGIEEQFYIFWPLLLILFCRLKLKIGALLFTLLAASFLLNVALIYSYPTATFYLPVTRVWELLIGSVLAYRSVLQNRPLVLWGSANLSAWLGFTLLILANIFINDRSAFPGWWALLPTLSAALLLSAGPSTWFNQHVLSSRLLVWFGLISYPLYLWHWPLLTFARILDGGRQPSSLVRICMVLLAILLAWLTYRLVEKPIRFHKNSFFTPLRLFLIGLVFFFISGVVYFNGGLPNRAAAQLKIANEGDIGHDEFRILTNQQVNYCVFQKVDSDFCTKKLKNYSRQIALLGDSHAEQLALGLTIENPTIGFVLYDTNQTLPFLSSPFSQNLIETIGKNKNIGAVILSAYWDLRASQLSNPGKYQTEIIETANYLSAAGKRAFVVSGIPNFTFLPTKCKYDWPFLRVQQCSESHFFESQQVRYSSEFIQASQNSKVILIDLKPLFCQGDTCRMAIDGQLLFRDDNHLGINGSKLAGKTISQALETANYSHQNPHAPN